MKQLNSDRAARRPPAHFIADQSVGCGLKIEKTSVRDSDTYLHRMLEADLTWKLVCIGVKVARHGYFLTENNGVIE